MVCDSKALPQLTSLLLVDNADPHATMAEAEVEIARVFEQKPAIEEIIIVQPPESSDYARAYHGVRGQPVTLYGVYTYDLGSSFGRSWMNANRLKAPAAWREEERLSIRELLPDMVDLEHLDWIFVLQEALANAADWGNRDGFRRILNELHGRGHLWDAAAGLSKDRFFMPPLTETLRASMIVAAKSANSKLRKGDNAEKDWVQEDLNQ